MQNKIPKLSQVLATEKGVKTQTYSATTEFHKQNQRSELFNGFTKSYEPLNADDAEKLPPESKHVQLSAKASLLAIERETTALLDLQLQKDLANCSAKADVVVDGQVLAIDVPATNLLSLEKQFVDMKKAIECLPTLALDEQWSYDDQSSLYKTQPVKQHRTKKMQKPIVLFAATPEHPAQTQLITEDILVGYWTTTKMSSALRPSEKAELLDRCERVIQALQRAREEANMIDAPPQSIGGALFSYINGSLFNRA